MKAWPIAMIILFAACASPPVDGDVGQDATALADANLSCEPFDAGGPDAALPLPEGTFLTSNLAWTGAEPEADPWYASRDTEKVPCAPADFVVEDAEGPVDQWFSVRTQNCGYATVSQPLLADVAACTDLVLHLWYWKFLPPKKTEGVGFQLAVTVGDDIDQPLLSWSGDALPPTSGLIYEIIQAPRALKAGEMVHFHVSNHGSNAWEFIQMRVLAPDAGP